MTSGRVTTMPRASSPSTSSVSSRLDAKDRARLLRDHDLALFADLHRAEDVPVAALAEYVLASGHSLASCCRNSYFSYL